MFLKYRPVRRADLAECQSCIRDGFAYDDHARANLIELWTELLARGAANAAVIEDIGAPEGRRIVWFSFKVFITEEYARFLKTEAAPLVGRQVLGSWLKDDLPVLGAAEVRRANSHDGLTMLILNSGAPDWIVAGGKLPAICDKVLEFTCYCCGGYRYNEMLGEFYDDYTCAWAEGAGMRLRTEYAGHHAVRSFDGRRPRLFGVTAREAAARAGTIASALFQYQAPRIYFSPPQQELLFHALLGATDEELARALDLALVTVRKRWDGIYEQVETLAPDLLPEPRKAAPESRRGCEKKRRLLSYLRHHLEELRPVERPKSAAERFPLARAA
jgi:hypothetical protein